MSPSIDRAGAVRVGALAWLGFGLLTLLVISDWSGLAELDAALSSRTHRFGVDHPGWLAAMRRLTQLGGSWVLAMTTAVATVLLVRSGRNRPAVLCVAAALLTWLSTQLVKSLTGRARPADAFWVVDGLAFPGGHASNTAVAAGIAVIAGWPLLRHRPRGRIALVGVAIAWALLVGLSRLAGSVHWPSDVLGGWLLGFAWIATLVAVNDWAAARSGT